jgi:uncharacterized protein (DUF58 family)
MRPPDPFSEDASWNSLIDWRSPLASLVRRARSLAEPRRVAAGLGALAVALAALAIAAPASTLEPVAGLFRGVGAAAVVGLFSITLIALSLLVIAWASPATEAGGADGEETAEPWLGADVGSAGERIDDLLAHVASDAIPWQTGDAVADEAEAVWEALRERAVEAVAERDGCSRTVASKRVATGEWTDDPYAASFLRDLSTPVLPFHVRIADWLRGRHLTRRIRRTVDAAVATKETATPLSGSAATGRSAGPRPGGGSSARTGAGVEATVDPPTAGTGVVRETRIELRPTGGPSGHGATAGLAVGVGAAVVGTMLGNAAVLLSAVVGCAYAAYGYAMPDPGTDLNVERWVETASPLPGAAVGVSFAVTNEGETAVPDLRVSDAPPEGLEVTGGETGLATSLAPGETVELSYRVEATTGTHAFGAAELTVRNVSGTARFRKEASLETELSCDYSLGEVPLSDQTTPFEGRVPADSGGSGTEFYATREYQPGDPPNRIDWNRYARTRDPSTVEFREHRAAKVVVVLDADSPAAAARRSTTADPATLGRHAAREIVADLLAAKNGVGAARIDRFDTTAVGRRELITYLQPQSDDLQSTRAERLFAVRLDDLGAALRHDPDLGTDAAGRCVRFKQDATARMVGTLPAETQVIVLSPLFDDAQVDTIVRLQRAGHDVTVVMPDVLPAGSPGGRIDRLDRADRIATVRRNGARVLPWAPDESLSVAVSPSARQEVVAP